jgi:hypothetical protein
VFIYYYDSGSVESGPKLSEGSSQVIKAASPEEAWKKLQKNLKMQKKVYKKYMKQLHRDRSKLNLPHWSWMYVIQHGPDRTKYSKDYFQVVDADSLDWHPQQESYELVAFYKYN